jgi:hypothetical protein
VSPFAWGGYADMLEAWMELLRPPVPTILLALVRGALMLAGRDMFLAGLYVGLGSLGKEAARSVLRGSFGGGPRGGAGMSRGPEGREDDWYSDGDGIWTDMSLSGRAVVSMEGPLSLANRSAMLFISPAPLTDAEC